MKNILLLILTVSFLFGEEEQRMIVGGGCYSNSPDKKWHVSITNRRDGKPVRIVIWNLADLPFNSLYFKGDKAPEFEARIGHRIYPRSGTTKFKWNEESTYLIVYFYCHKTDPPTKKEFHYDFMDKDFLISDTEAEEVEPTGTGQPM